MHKLSALTRPERLQKSRLPVRAQARRILKQKLNALDRGVPGWELDDHGQEKGLVVAHIEALTGTEAGKVRRRDSAADVPVVLGVRHVRQLSQQRAEIGRRALPRADQRIQCRGRRGDILAGLFVGGFMTFVVVFQQLSGYYVEGFRYGAPELA